MKDRHKRMSWEESLAFAKDHIATLWAKGDEPEVHGVFYLHSLIGVLCVPMTDLSKDAYADVVRNLAKAAQAYLAIFTCEAWYLKAVSEDEWREDHVMPSQHPDRIEAVFCTVEDAHRMATLTWDIIRSGNGRATLGEPQVLLTSKDESSPASITGRMTGMVSQVLQ